MSAHQNRADRHAERYAPNFRELLPRLRIVPHQRDDAEQHRGSAEKETANGAGLHRSLPPATIRDHPGCDAERGSECDALCDVMGRYADCHTYGRAERDKDT